MEPAAAAWLPGGRTELGQAGDRSQCSQGKQNAFKIEAHSKTKFQTWQGGAMTPSDSNQTSQAESEEGRV